MSTNVNFFVYLDITIPDELVKGTRYIITTIEDKEVLNLLLDTFSLSMKQIMYIEELATKCRIKLPDTIINTYPQTDITNN